MKIYSVLLAFVLATVALAADVSGKWTFETEGRNGTMTNTLTLQASGGSLTGTISGGRGGDVNISDGKIDGDKISFTVVREFRGNTFTTKYSGTVSGDELKLTIEGPRGGPREITAKRST
ncbi:MAG: hypothetical protein ABSB86_17505 [Bryobacteraceae bacterium]|jgi:hypothetical protein